MARTIMSFAIVIILTIPVVGPWLGTDNCGSNDESCIGLAFLLAGSSVYAQCPNYPWGSWTGADVTYLVMYFKGVNAPKGPCCNSTNHSINDMYPQMDYNGSCSNTGADVTYLVRYFKGIGDPPVPCNPPFNPNGCSGPPAECDQC